MLTVASYGGGVNSTAMIIGMIELGEPIDLILFADTGGEKPETYAYIKRFNEFLLGHNMAVRIVRYVTREDGEHFEAGHVLTLEEYCLATKTLPSIVYGYKRCSQKYKGRPQDHFLEREWQPAKDAWARGEIITKLVGFDAGEPQRAKDYSDGKYTLRYPLIEWGWDREACIKAIARNGLCIPPKSSCFFCPNMRENEILDLKELHPDLFSRAVAMEQNAKSQLVTIRGLARDMSWEQIGNYDRDQLSLLPKIERSMPCECYDGDD